MPGQDEEIRGVAGDELMSELKGLVDAGLLVEVRRAGQLSRYALTRAGENLAIQRDAAIRPRPALKLKVRGGSDGGYAPPPPWPEPCHHCGANVGYDGGRRCLRCYVASPPEMA